MVDTDGADAVTEPGWIRRPTTAASAAAGLLSAAVMYLVNFAGRGWSLTIPRSYESDGVFHLMLVQGIRRTGWYQHNPSLGVPFGQDLRDFPQELDNAMLAMLRGLTWLVEPVAAINLLLLLSAAVIGVVTCVVLRRLGCGPTVSCVFAVIYATYPAHQVREATHIMLSCYWTLPMGGWMALELLGGRSLIRGGRSTAWSLVALAACTAVIASSGSYYAVFAVIVIAVGAIGGALRSRAWRPVLEGLGTSAVVFAVAVLNLLPTIRFWMTAGAAERAALRTPQQAISGGLRPWQILPGNATVAARTSFEVAGSYVGLVSLLGLVAVSAGMLGRGRLRRSAAGVDRAAPAWRDPVARDAVLLAVACLVIAAPRSVSYLLSVAGFTWIREWHRMSMLIAFFGIVAGARMVECCQPRSRLRARLLLVSICLASIDLVPYVSTPAADAERLSKWDSDVAFFAAMQHDLAPGSVVVNLPFQPFPEIPGFGGAGAYDPARGYVHAPLLRWDFGAMHTRVPPPPPNLGGDPVCYAHSLGASAILVDLRSLPPGPGSMSELLARRLAVDPQVSRDHRYSWYDLRNWSGDCTGWPAAAG